MSCNTRYFRTRAGACLCKRGHLHSVLYAFPGWWFSFAGVFQKRYRYRVHFCLIFSGSFRRRLYKSSKKVKFPCKMGVLGQDIAKCNVYKNQQGIVVFFVLLTTRKHNLTLFLLITMGLIIAIYKDTVPWPLYICTCIKWTLINWEKQSHTHNLK